MLFFLRKLITALFYPLSLCFVLLAAALVWRRRRVLLLVTALLLLCLSGCPPLPDVMIRSLAGRYPHVEMVRPDVHDILVLAGGTVSVDETLPLAGRIPPDWLYRFMEGVRLYRALPDSRLWISIGGWTDEALAGRLLDELAGLSGVPRDRLTSVLGAMTTRDEAWLMRDRLDLDTPFYLVTTDYHIPRSMLLFEQAGLRPLAAPVGTSGIRRDRRIRQWLILVPRLDFIQDTQRAVHEYLGMAWARVRG